MKELQLKLLNSKKIFFFTDYGEDIGFGNYQRSLTLYKILKKNFKVNLIKKTSKFKKIINFDKEKIDLVIFDLPYFPKKLFYQAKLSKTKILAFDWFFKQKPDFNIIIYPHKKVSYLKKKLIGLQYLSLSNDLQLKEMKKINNFLIVLGGGDIRNQSIKVANFLLKQGHGVSLVIGPLIKNFNYKDLQNKIKIFKNPKNLYSLYLMHDFIITNGGMCMVEANFLNKKIFALPQTKKELAFAKFFFYKKAILDYGFNKLKKFDFINIKHNTKNIVDNEGPNRILKFIKKNI